MADPTTSNILLAIPTRGSDVGVWDTPVNGDFTALDGILGGNATISLSVATTLLLSVPATGTVSAVAGPNQSQNAVIKFTGTLAGNAVVQLTLPRTYIFDNQCTVATSYIQIAPASGTGTKIGLPPGQKTRVAYDGTNVDYVGMPLVGSFLDICVSTTPVWMTACTTLPWLLADGTTYSTSIYSALGNMLGSSFGGNGITTFGVPDVQSRSRISLDTGGVNRVTNATSGIAGATLGATGGDQRMQSHIHGITEPNGGLGHNHPLGGPIGYLNPTGSTVYGTAGSGQTTGNAVTGITINNTGTGSSQNMPPVIVFGLTFIKT